MIIALIKVLSKKFITDSRQTPLQLQLLYLYMYFKQIYNNVYIDIFQ